MASVGLLGGTFNPPHLGHLVCAQEAHGQLGLDLVVFVPTSRPPHKEAQADPGASLRHQLCELAVAKDGRLAASSIELERPGPSYTVDTLRLLTDRAPEDELTFIVGGDMGRDLPNWREPDAVLRLARVAVAERAGARRDEIRAAIAGLPGADRVVFFDMPRIDVSSTMVRRRVAAGQPIRYLVPDEVVNAIGAHGLYRGEETT